MGCNLLHSLYVIVTEGPKSFLVLFVLGAVILAGAVAYLLYRVLRPRKHPDM